jgi:hypothetical protein
LMSGGLHGTIHVDTRRGPFGLCLKGASEAISGLE